MAPAFGTFATSVVLALAATVQAQEASWTLGPPLQIGAALGDPAFEFGEIGGVAELPNGTIVVSDWQADEIRGFGQGGQHLWTQGREGEGPGEFLFPKWLGACRGDSIFVFDSHLRRVTVLGPEGSVERIVTDPWGLERTAYLLACDRSGHFVVADWPTSPRGLADPTREAYGTTFTVVVGDADGRVLRELGEFPGGDRVSTFSNGRLTGSGPRHLSATTHLAIHDGMAYVGPASTPVVHLHAEDQRTSIAVPFEANAVEDADLDRYVEEQLVRLEDPNRRRAAARRLEGYPFPEQYPFYSAIHTDPAGRLWVRSYPDPAPGIDTVAWAILDGKTGQLIAKLRTPETFQVHSVGLDYLIGIWVDDFGVKYVRRYPINRP